MKKLRKDFPSLTEAVEAQAVANLAAVDAIENSDHNKEATDKAKEDATKVVDKFVADEEKLADKDKPEEKDIVKGVKKETGLKEGLALDEETNETKSVSSKDYYKALQVLQREAAEASHGRRGSIDVVEMYWDSPVQLGVNWSAVGSVEPDTALEFADRLKRLAEKARDFKYNGYTVDYGDYANEALCEEVGEPIFDKIYKEIIRIPYVKDENALHTAFAKDNQSATISIDIFDELDLDEVYDVIDRYRDGITTVSEDKDQIKIVIDTPYVETAEDRDLYDEIYTQLTSSGRLIPNAGAKGWKIDKGVGYNARHQISAADGDKLGIEVRIPADTSAMDSDEDASYVDSLEPAREIARKYADFGVTFDERGEIQSTDPVRVDQILTIWIPKNMKAPERDARMSDRSRGLVGKEKDSNSGVEESVRTKEDPWGLLK